jgi:hypothetical protein
MAIKGLINDATGVGIVDADARYALSSGGVDLTTNQSISGTKTFISPIIYAPSAAVATPGAVSFDSSQNCFSYAVGASSTTTIYGSGIFGIQKGVMAAISAAGSLMSTPANIVGNNSGGALSLQGGALALGSTIRITCYGTIPSACTGLVLGMAGSWGTTPFITVGSLAAGVSFTFTTLITMIATGSSPQMFISTLTTSSGVSLSYFSNSAISVDFSANNFYVPRVTTLTSGSVQALQTIFEVLA